MQLRKQMNWRMPIFNSRNSDRLCICMFSTCTQNFNSVTYIQIIDVVGNGTCNGFSVGMSKVACVWISTVLVKAGSIAGVGNVVVVISDVKWLCGWETIMQRKEKEKENESLYLKDRKSVV